MLKQTFRALLGLVPALLAACSQSSGGAGNTESLTYDRDVKPILDARCTGCHTAGGIAPFSLTTFDGVAAQKDAIVLATSSGVMPPWPPDGQCARYAGDRSLSPAQIDTISRWVQGGAQEGDPAEAGPPAAAAAAGPSRVDRTLALPAPYTPVISPDEYRCFLLDWPEPSDTFITGFGVTPGDPAIVHHVLAYVVAPADVATYQAYDDADAGLGYSCFGGPRATGAPNGAPAPIIGAWVPGALGGDLPASTGIAIAAGSKLILQVHYNTLYSAPAPDQSQIALKLDASVDKPAHVLPFTNPSWVRRHTMDIPAGAGDVMHAFTFDAGTFATAETQGAIDASSPFTIYSAALHMHLRGSHATLSLQPAAQPATTDPVCLLRIPRWDFHWQGSYAFTDPKTVNPGDSFSIECHWDNSAQNQPVVGGQQLAPADLNWGEGSTDEMCLGFVYATQ